MIVDSDRFTASIRNRSGKARSRLDPTPSVIFQIVAEGSDHSGGRRLGVTASDCSGRTTKMATPLRHGTVVERWLVWEQRTHRIVRSTDAIAQRAHRSGKGGGRAGEEVLLGGAAGKGTTGIPCGIIAGGSTAIPPGAEVNVPGPVGARGGAGIAGPNVGAGARGRSEEGEVCG